MMYFIFLSAAVAVLWWLLATPPAKKQTHHSDPKIDGELIRGARVLSTSHTAEIVAKKSPNGLGMTLAGVTLPASADVTSYMFQGAPRSGKSLSLIQAMTYARENNHRSIIIDNGSAFLRRFWREGDIILNPFDSRSENFSLFTHIHDDWDCLRLAKSVMPDSDDANANEWAGYSQVFLSSVLLALHRKGGQFATTEELVRVLTVAPIDELETLCAGMPITPMLSQEKLFGSVRSILASKIAVFTYLKSTGPFFSLTDFIRDDTGSQFVFITYRDDQFDMLKPLIATQIDILISASLSIPESRTRRIFYMLDEFSNLGRINSIVPLLERGAKYGCSTILGLQSVSQCQSAYGDKMATTIFSCLGTWLCLRSPDPSTAEFISKILGKRQMIRTSQSQGGSADAGVGWSQTTAEEYAVMGSELQALDNCEGYLKIVGDFHPARIRVPYAPDVADKTAAFSPRDFKAERAALAVEQATEVAAILDEALFLDAEQVAVRILDDLEAIQSTEHTK